MRFSDPVKIPLMEQTNNQLHIVIWGNYATFANLNCLLNCASVPHSLVKAIELCWAGLLVSGLNREQTRAAACPK